MKPSLYSGAPAWEAEWPELLPGRVWVDNFRSETGLFGHLIQAVLSI